MLLEHGKSKIKQGKPSSKKAHFLREEGRACMACLHGESGPRVARVEAKSHPLHILEARLEWCGLEVCVCA